MTKIRKYNPQINKSSPKTYFEHRAVLEKGYVEERVVVDHELHEEELAHRWIRGTFSSDSALARASFEEILARFGPSRCRD